MSHAPGAESPPRVAKALRSAIVKAETMVVSSAAKAAALKMSATGRDRFSVRASSITGMNHSTAGLAVCSFSPVSIVPDRVLRSNFPLRPDAEHHEGAENTRAVSVILDRSRNMPKCRVTLVALLLVFSSSLAFGCSCSNSTPIQRTSEKYRDRAVFTAHVVQLMGKIYNWDGKRLSSQVLAVVKDRYWGLPWYWPKVVLLDGSYPCDIAMEEGKDYLVSGRRERYGVLGVAVCSRTQPLETAQLDLHTLDGSHCAGPGGTIIGHVYKREDDRRENPLARGVPLTFRDQDGKTHSASSDQDGILELLHLAAGTYVLDSRSSENQYLSSYEVSVTEGVCGETSVLLGKYHFSGRVPPALGRYATVKLVGLNSPEDWIGGDLQPDGGFYFRNVSDGEYFLALHVTAHGAEEDFYYPGTTDRKKAKLIKILNHRPAESLDFSFSPESLPIVPIPVALDPPIDSGRFSWRVDLLSSNNLDTEAYWTPGQKFAIVYGVRGWPYNVGLYGYSKNPTAYGDCISQNTTRVVARDGLGITRIAVPSDCR